MVFPLYCFHWGSTMTMETMTHPTRKRWPMLRRCMGACLDPHHRHQLSTVDPKGLSSDSCANVDSMVTSESINGDRYITITIY